ncbi:MAG: hypothetical protein G01um101416_1004 [Microgenomates group bacterium Gr01-1014_16]|nr:MAG: hypothetical protein G01um101416_1004 [Microgenomates group bacterium Gr01-1014_16]
MAHRGKTAKNYDDYRKSYLKELGVKVLEFWNQEVMDDVDGVTGAIKIELNVRTSPLPLSFEKERE